MFDSDQSLTDLAEQQFNDLRGEPFSAVTLTQASAINIKPVSWLWGGWLAAGKMHVIGGAPGTGKTTIAMSLAATVTTGGRWPDGSRSPIGNVAIWSGEDDPGDTLVPRLALAGADLNRVYFIGDVRQGREVRSFDPAKDMQPLSRKLAEIGGARLLVVDPIVSAVAGDSHKNAEVRRGLQPLCDLAASLDCALLGITHFSKGTGGRDPVERLTGSLAFGALARVVLVAAKVQNKEDDQAQRVLLRAKSNIGPDDGGFGYELQQAELPRSPGIISSAVMWARAIEGSARFLLADADSTDEEGGSLADAKRFLLDLLESGPVPAKQVKSEAREAGHSDITLRRAKDSLGIQAVKQGGFSGGASGKWVWQLPDSDPKVIKKIEDAQQKTVSTFGDFDHLRAEDDREVFL